MGIKKVFLIFSGVFSLMFGLTSCHSLKEVKPLTQTGSQYSVYDDEKKLITQAKRLNEKLLNKGLFFPDQKLYQYVNGIALKLTPQLVLTKIKPEVFIYRSPISNAFALASGHIYITIGLIGNLKTEEELAYVIAHELAHIINRHSLLGLRQKKNSLIAGNVMNMFLLGTNLIYLSSVSSIMNYSRDQEKQADIDGLELLFNAGYSIKNASNIFQSISNIKKSESLLNSVYSSHPNNSERELYVQAEIDKYPTQSNNIPIDQSSYISLQEKVFFEDIELKLLTSRYELAKESLERKINKAENENLYYWLAEAYRFMADDPEGLAREYLWKNQAGDFESLVAEFKQHKAEYIRLAKENYFKSISFNANKADNYYGLGMLSWKHNKKEDAVKMFNEFLSLTKDKTNDKRIYLKALLKQRENRSSNE